MRSEYVKLVEETKLNVLFETFVREMTELVEAVDVVQQTLDVAYDKIQHLKDSVYDMMKTSSGDEQKLQNLKNRLISSIKPIHSLYSGILNKQSSKDIKPVGVDRLGAFVNSLKLALEKEELNDILSALPVPSEKK